MPWWNRNRSTNAAKESPHVPIPDDDDVENAGNRKEIGSPEPSPRHRHQRSSDSTCTAGRRFLSASNNRRRASAFLEIAPLFRWIPDGAPMSSRPRALPTARSSQLQDSLPWSLTIRALAPSHLPNTALPERQPAPARSVPAADVALTMLLGGELSVSFLVCRLRPLVEHLEPSAWPSLPCSLDSLSLQSQALPKVRFRVKLHSVEEMVGKFSSKGRYLS